MAMDQPMNLLTGTPLSGASPLPHFDLSVSDHADSRRDVASPLISDWVQADRVIAARSSKLYRMQHILTSVCQPTQTSTTPAFNRTGHTRRRCSGASRHWPSCKR
ncbi:hypothetical protein PS720_05597 [Pseudomonas fluorescens]|nr:hypothetical protein PS720_05597 [Pseudomonas fluorescens]